MVKKATAANPELTQPGSLTVYQLMQHTAICSMYPSDPAAPVVAPVEPKPEPLAESAPTASEGGADVPSTPGGAAEAPAEAPAVGGDVATPTPEGLRFRRRSARLISKRQLMREAGASICCAGRFARAR